jgi:plastocyanin
VGDNSSINTMWRWNYDTGSSTGEQYDCSLGSLPADLEYAPPGGTGSKPTFEGPDRIPGPAVPATIWRKYPGNQGAQDPMAFGDLGPGGMQPVTGPVYRYKEGAGPGAFPAYYDGSWLITNRGAENGFWKEVRLRGDDNQMLRVNDWLPYNTFGTPTNSFVIPTRFGADGALYMARWSFGCCRNQQTPEGGTELIKVEFGAAGECVDDTQAPTVTHTIDGRPAPDQPDAYLGSATLRLTANDVGCAGVDTIEYRVDGGAWTSYSGPVTFDDERSYTVEYRATDRSGNASEPRSATFAVVSEGEPPAACDVRATGTTWTPDRCGVGVGGTVNWRFDQPDAQFPHDVWLTPPGGNPDPNGGDSVQVTDGPVAPGGAPVSHTFETAGAWQFVCRVHSSYSGGQWAGMVGTVDVSGG